MDTSGGEVMATGWRKGGYVTHVTHARNETNISPTANGDAIPFEPTAQEIAMWWESLSPLRSKAVTGTAVRRFRAYARKVEPELLWLALGELAVEGLPAHYFTERIARERVARIREVVREIEKREERASPLTRDGQLRSLAAIIRGAA